MKKKFFTHLFILISIFSFGQEPLKTKEAAHEGGVNAACISSDGTFVLTCGNDMKTYLWNIKTGDKLKGALKHNDKVSAIAINYSNKFYVSGSADLKIRVVDIEQGMPIRILSEHTSEISALAFNPLTDYIASGSKDNTIKIWDNTKSKVSIFTLRGHTKEITALCYSPDGKLLASGSLDNTIKIWNESTGELKTSIEANSKGVTSLCFSADGKYLASGGVNGNLIVWDPNTGTKISDFSGFSDQINSVSFSPDVQYISAGGNNKKVIIWKVETKKIEKEIVAHTTDVTAALFSDKGDVFVTASKDGSFKVWDVSSLKIGTKKFMKSADEAKISSSGLGIKDDNTNGIIEGGEKASLIFTLNNSGKGAAFNLVAKITLETLIPEIKFEKEFIIGNLDAGKTKTVSIPLVVNSELQSGNGVFNITITEANGYNPSPLKLNFQTGGSSSYSYIMVLGQGYTSATGKAEIGAPITLKLKIKNITKGVAKNIKINFLLPDHVLATNKLSEVIPSMTAGEEKEILLDFYADKNFILPEIKMGIDIEGVAFTNAKDILLKVKMNEKLPVNEDYSNEVVATTTQLEQKPESEASPLYRGGGDPLKGLNVSKPKEMVIGNYYALIIGVDKYSGAWPVLVNAVNDAKALEKIMRTSYKCEFIQTLYNEQATREAIIKKLEWLVENVKEKDNVIIYYSGHGEYKKELSKGYWVPVDATTASTAKYISNSDIQTYISGIKSKHTLLVSDACFSGDIFRGNTLTVPFEESEKYYKEVQSLSSRQALTSGGLEPVMDGGKDGHSVFAYYLLKTLETNQGKYFDASQLYTKIKIPVINNSEQTPKFSPIKNAGDEGGQFIFIKK
jgi:WD40 repeat protein